MTDKKLESIAEAILFASGEPVSRGRILLAAECSEEELDEALNDLRDRYASRGSGIRISFVGDTVVMSTAIEYAEYVRKALEMTKAPSLSLPSLEVLAIIAANQPATRAFVDQIRGVDSSYTVSSLVDKCFIEEDGRLDVPGRPILYKTTAEFLRVFHVRDVEELLEIPEIAALRAAEEETAREGAQAEQQEPPGEEAGSEP